MSRSIQQDIKELGEKTGSIRFGQHLAEFKDPNSSTVRKLQTSVNSRQWNDLLSSRPGPSPAPQSTLASIKGSGQSFPSLDPKQNASLSGGHPVGNQELLIDEWDFGEEDEPSQRDIGASDTFSGSGEGVDSVQLLILMHEKWLPMLEVLISSLSELDYSLRKRMLAHPKTKEFLSGYREIVEVGERIMAGRYRRKSPESRQKTDREARQLEHVWHELKPRYHRIVGGIDDLPQLNSKVTFSSKLGSGNHCTVCGLLKTELIHSGITEKRPEWIGSKGHKTCINWFNNAFIDR